MWTPLALSLWAITGMGIYWFGREALRPESPLFTAGIPLAPAAALVGMTAFLAALFSVLGVMCIARLFRP